MHLPAGGDFVLEVHYHPSGKRTTDRSQLGLYFADEPVERYVEGLVIGNRGHRHHGRRVGLPAPRADDAADRGRARRRVPAHALPRNHGSRGRDAARWPRGASDSHSRLGLPLAEHLRVSRADPPAEGHADRPRGSATTTRRRIPTTRARRRSACAKVGRRPTRCACSISRSCSTSRTTSTSSRWRCSGRSSCRRIAEAMTVPWDGRESSRPKACPGKTRATPEVPPASRRRFRSVGAETRGGGPDAKPRAR